ncbi:MAG: hypothetical protein Q4A58_02835 [Fusobacterium sp.]|nr:hypothetical protein [Fusobacterium sp.]MDO4690213.1 hypothetical protein [Fusobacterium sp.]
MKKIFLITFLSLASFIFPASFNEEEKVILKPWEYKTLLEVFK